MSCRIKTSLIATIAIIGSASAFAASLEEHTINPKEIRVVSKAPTPEPDHVITKILYPRDREVETSLPIKGQIKVEGYALGVDSDFPRKKEIYNDDEGQAIHIIIDNQPYFAVNEDLLDALDVVEEYFDQTAQFTIPFKLQPGMHTIRAFPVRSFNESVKTDNSFAAGIFYYKQKKSENQVDLSLPYLTYNEPQGEYSFNNEQPILLDFYISNCELSKDGYKIRLTIDNTDKRILTEWIPYYIYGLGKGMHTIRLELLGRDNQPIGGYFNDIQRTIVIK